MHIESCDPRVVELVQVYLEKLGLPDDNLYLTTSRNVFGSWVNRSVPYRYGGAYSLNTRTGSHRVLVHLERLNLDIPWAIEVVVAEELIHMRDHLRGDFRRHAHHGHDRIALAVEAATGFSPEQQRQIFKPRSVREYRHLYQCPNCRRIIARRRRGTWSCALCAPRWRRKWRLKELPIDRAPAEALEMLTRLNQQLRESANEQV